MIAPEPSLASALSAARPRDARHAETPRHEAARRDADFGSVLKEAPEKPRGKTTAAVAGQHRTAAEPRPDAGPEAGPEESGGTTDTAAAEKAAAPATPHAAANPANPPESVATDPTADGVDTTLPPAAAMPAMAAADQPADAHAEAAAPSLATGAVTAATAAATPGTEAAAAGGATADAPARAAATPPTGAGLASADAAKTASPAAAPAIAAAAAPVAASQPRPEAAERDLDPASRHSTSATEPAGRDGAPPPAAAPTAAPASPATPAETVLRDAAAPSWQLTAEHAPVSHRTDAILSTQSALPASQAAPVAPHAVMQQLAVAVGSSSDDDIELRLDPPELGRVQIHLTRHDGAIQAVVLADRPETQDLLRRNAEVLARELGEAGYDQVSLDFGRGEARTGQDEGRNQEWGQLATGSATAAEPVSTAPARRPAGNGALDIRL